MIKWKLKKFDSRIIAEIVRRGRRHAQEHNIAYSAKDMEMDITACHLNGCPLDLLKLLGSPEGDFGHDIFGIRRFISRTTGKLSPRFDPRCSMPATANAKK